MFLGYRTYILFFLVAFALRATAAVGPKPKVSQTIFCSPQKEPITPENTIFAFDFHDVITASKGWPKWQTRARILWNSPCFGTIIKHSPMLIYTLYSLRNQLNVAEQAYQKIIDLYPELEACKDTFLQIANAQRANKKTQAIMKALKDQGFKLYLFSNIGEVTFADLQERHPDLLNHLNGFCIVKTADGYISKPDPRIYEQFNNQFNPDRSKQVIFIDDIRKNVNAGCNADMIGILFKDADQLYRDLIKLGIALYPEEKSMPSLPEPNNFESQEFQK